MGCAGNRKLAEKEPSEYADSNPLSPMSALFHDKNEFNGIVRFQRAMLGVY
jgi:hypothetical protein